MRILKQLWDIIAITDTKFSEWMNEKWNVIDVESLIEQAQEILSHLQFLGMSLTLSHTTVKFIMGLQM